jgi:hypothetical protein
MSTDVLYLIPLKFYSKDLRSLLAYINLFWTSILYTINGQEFDNKPSPTPFKNISEALLYLGVADTIISTNIEDDDFTEMAEQFYTDDDADHISNIVLTYNNKSNFSSTIFLKYIEKYCLDTMWIQYELDTPCSYICEFKNGALVSPLLDCIELPK